MEMMCQQESSIVAILDIGTKILQRPGPSPTKFCQNDSRTLTIRRAAADRGSERVHLS